MTRKLLAIMHALAKFKQYLVGERFVVKIDHNNLKYFLNQNDLNERQQKWVSKLQGYDFGINGKRNVVVDALSRRPHLCSISILSAHWKERMQADYAKNALANSIVNGSLQDDKYQVRDGLIFYKERLYVSP